ncbi:MAG: autotransporter domain-containing protein [Planctomycetaceae bacterium]|jgi:autotransporter-associated beta strand protein|nr:autotransporter domain-containing protein [Planctomycetaceae bacterium]
MKTMNGFMNELVVRKTTKKNWRTRCGSFLVAILATCYSGTALNFATAAELQRSGGYGPQTTIDPSQDNGPGTPNIGATFYTIGKNGEAATWEVAENRPQGLVLNDVDSGLVQAYLLYTEPDPDVRVGTVTFTAGDIFRGTGDAYTLDSDLSWFGAFDATGTFHTQGYELTIESNNFSVGPGGLLINYSSASDTYSNVGRMIVRGGSNGNIINIGTGTLRVGGNFSNNGTIDISSLGVLEIESGKHLSGIINGGGFNGATTELGETNNSTYLARGCIDLLGNAKFSGTWTGEITVNSANSDSYLGYSIPTELGGFTLNARGSNGSGLTTLRILGGTDVLIDNQTNLGTAANVIFGNGGYLTKPSDVGELTLSNNIIFNTRMGGLGGVNVNGNVVSWTDNADFIYDSGNRVILNGLIDSTLTRGNTFHINYDFNGSGAVAITNTGNTYDGSYHIHEGALEISDARALGPHGDALHSSATNGIIIGDSSSIYSDPAYRAAFRFVGEGGITNPQIMERWIEVAHISSAYEVFTASNRITSSDTNQANNEGDTEGTNEGDTEGTNQVDNGATIVTSYVDNGATISDINRLHVIQNGLIGGAGNLNKAGDGVLILNSDQNTYTGNTIIHHGVLSISSNLQVNDTASRRIIIGTTNYQSDGFRPVFETTLGADPKLRPESGTVMIRYANVEVNLNNSVIRTTGEGNETIIQSDVVSEGTATSRFAVLNKEGAGTLTLQGNGRWGYNGEGQLAIRQGTVQFSHVTNLTTGNITIGLDLDNMADPVVVKDIDRSVEYAAVLKLADNMNTVTLTNTVRLGSRHDSYFNVGIGSELAVNGVIGQVQNVSADLNKTGLGSLILNGTSNAYTGWTDIEQGTIRTTKANNLVTSQGVDLIGEGTTLDLSTAGANQTLNGLRGGTDVDSVATLENSSDWTRKILIGDNTLTLNIQNFKDGNTQNRNENEFRGNIIGTGTVVKQGSLTVASGFDGFNGTFDIQAGILQTLTDTTLVGIQGKAGTSLDIRDNRLTINIGSNQQYDGTIMSSYPALPYSRSVTSRPSIIKDGAGTLTASFYNPNIGSGVVQSFQGDLTIKQGNIISNSDFYMTGNSNLTFYVNPDLLGSVNPLILDVSKHSAIFQSGGTTGKETSTVHVYAGENTTGWTTPSGITTVGKILGNDKSDYTGLKAATTDSLYYTLGLQDVYSGAGRHDLYVNLNVTGFGGVGNTFNTKAVGDYIDRARVTDLTKTGLTPLIQGLWAFGNNITDSSVLAANSINSTDTLSRAERLTAVRGLLQQIAPDTIANGMFMGLDQPWRVAFDRLNLDSQMVYVAPSQGPPQQYRGQIIANMRNLWFTPTVQTVSVRSDGNARRFGIDRPGYKIGFDKRVAQNTSVGFQLGYSAPKLRENDDRIEGSDFQAGIYGGSMVGSYIELKGFIGFGHQNFKSNRNVYVNLPDYPSQSLVAHGRYNGDTFNFSFDVSRPLFLGFAILRPTIGLDSEHAFRYSFTETGSPIAMKFERSSLSRTRARFGLSLETTTLDRAIFTGRLGYSALLGGHDFATANGVMVGTNVPSMSVRSVAVGKSFFEAGVGTKVFLNPVKTLALVGNYDATVANRWAEHQALVGFTYIY